MAIVAVSIAPAATETSVSAYVAEAIRVLEAQEAVRWELSSMFTTLEGDLDDIFSLIRAMQEAVFAKGAERVSDGDQDRRPARQIRHDGGQSLRGARGIG